MGYAHYQYIKVEVEDKVATMTLNRPHRLNAFLQDMHREMIDAWRKLEEDNEVRAIVLTGAGRAFGAGGDVRDMLAQLTPMERAVESLSLDRQAAMAVLSVTKPIICAVNGVAVASACTLALMCDVVIAAENARFGDPHVKVGLTSNGIGVAAWALQVGINRAKEYLMTGDIFDSREAERIGLVNHVVPEGQAYAEAMKLAKRLADGAPLAIRWTKVALNQRIQAYMNLALDTGAALEGLSMLTEDNKEGLRAYNEKRTPIYKGR